MKHGIKAVSKRTGLSPHVIRIWEKRYGAVQPSRTETNRRLYSDEEVERLDLLHQATLAGHNISQAARLTTEKLRELLMGAPSGGGELIHRAEVTPRAPVPATHAVAECLERVRALDANGLDESLHRLVVQFGQMGFLNRVAAPLSQEVGELWRRGEITAAHEHFLSAALRTFLGRTARQFAPGENAPVLLVATPAGQLHELGAVMVHAAAANLGWRVTYLGVNLPAAEIAGAAIQNRARAVALSIVYPEDDPNLAGELNSLRRYLPSEVRILAGGRACEAYREVLNRIGARQIADLSELGGALDELRQAA